MERDVRGAAQHNLFCEISLKRWDQLAQPATRATNLVVKNKESSVYLTDFKSIFGYRSYLAGMTEQRDQKLGQPFARSLNVDCQLSDVRGKSVDTVQLPI